MRTDFHPPALSQAKGLGAIFAMLLFFALVGTVPVNSVPGESAGEWHSVGGDPGERKYSPLDQINRKNVARLQEAWVYDTGDVSDGTTYPTQVACTFPFDVNFFTAYTALPPLRARGAKIRPHPDESG
jgi:hypothetical protein